MFKPIVICAALAVPVLTAAPVAASAASKPACGGDVISVWVGQPTACDVSPPQRLDVLIPIAVGLDAARATCDAMGAVDITDANANVYTCEGVDF